jgi:hypothetical protein
MGSPLVMTTGFEYHSNDPCRLIGTWGCRVTLPLPALKKIVLRVL